MVVRAHVLHVGVQINKYLSCHHPVVFLYSQCFIAFLSSCVKFSQKLKGLNSCNYRTAGQPSCRCSAGLISWGKSLNLWIGDVGCKYIIYIHYMIFIRCILNFNRIKNNPCIYTVHSLLAQFISLRPFGNFDSLPTSVSFDQGQPSSVNFLKAWSTVFFFDSLTEKMALQPLKINMEAKNHPISKRKFIWTKAPCLCSMLIFRGVVFCWRFFFFWWSNKSEEKRGEKPT